MQHKLVEGLYEKYEVNSKTFFSNISKQVKQVLDNLIKEIGDE